MLEHLAVDHVEETTFESALKARTFLDSPLSLSIASEIPSCDLDKIHVLEALEYE